MRGPGLRHQPVGADAPWPEPLRARPERDGSRDLSNVPIAQSTNALSQTVLTGVRMKGAPIPEIEPLARRRRSPRNATTRRTGAARDELEPASAVPVVASQTPCKRRAEIFGLDQESIAGLVVSSLCRSPRLAPRRRRRSGSRGAAWSARACPLAQAPDGVVDDGLQHRDAGLPPASSPMSARLASTKPADRVEGILVRVIERDCRDSVHAGAADEHAEPAEHSSDVVVQEATTPLHGRRGGCSGGLAVRLQGRGDLSSAQPAMRACGDST